MPLILPIGPMYWDTYIYLDAAQRIKLGQIPAVDFLAPVGALDYYQFYWLQTLFPGGQPTLLAQWSVLISAAPLMAVIIAAIDKRSRKIAFAILVPFLIFALCPINTQSFHSYPGVNGFGVYNRHTSLLLYVLTSALVFLPSGRKLAIIAALTMLALFLTKITGFLAGGLIGLFAILAGRFMLRHLLLAAGIFALVLLGLELNHGMISAYLKSIAALVGMNEGLLLSRFLTVFSIKLDVILAAAALILFLYWLDRGALLKNLNSSRQSQTTEGFASLLDRDWLWIGVVLVAGIFLETQNTGSQEFIFLWPVLLAMLLKTSALTEKHRLIVYCLVAFTAIPTVTKVVHGTLRFVAVAPTYVAAPVTDVKTMGLVSTRRDVMDRAELLESHYAQNPGAYRQLAEQDQLPSWQLYSELDYQMYWIISADRVVKAIKEFESDNGVRLNNLMTLDFVNPFPWILDRDATRNIQIGADPFRTVGSLTAAEEASLRATDGVLRPGCPITSARILLQNVYEKTLADRTVVKLNECWDLLLRPDIKLSGQS
ncbi:hypothetical protein B5P45_05070 [Phyllobacterium zundukense]|uniref:Glycosyltransferase RgtA/B/C/D-like domain-containing protein n=1 Tax=Phyllobacterium zundukense TaxID=1867719 RepID=A0A2N9W2S3_9HYPH|nr:hypothetical protein BLM14_05365 [Phyllobacterium zundukense]PIO46041.1 hypothetical protein B5P45_05070 [Phyllobacterium zundukense]